MTSDPKEVAGIRVSVVSDVPQVHVSATADPNPLVQKLWDFCDVLRDDGLSYGDYLEQLTYLLFLKMANEQHELLGGGVGGAHRARLAVAAEPVGGCARSPLQRDPL